MAATYFNVSDPGNLSEWISQFNDNPEVYKGWTRCKRVFIALYEAANKETHMVDNGKYLLTIDQVLPYFANFTDALPIKDPQKKLLKDLSALKHQGVIQSDSLDHLPRGRNGKHPTSYSIKPFSQSPVISTATPISMTERLKQGRRIAQDITNAVVSGKIPGVNTSRYVNLKTPVNLRITTSLIAHFARPNLKAGGLQVESDLELFGIPMDIKAFSTGEVLDSGVQVGRIILDDAKILYYLQTRDSQIIANKIKAGEPVENIFTVDLQELIRDLNPDNPDASLTGNSLKAVSKAIQRIAGMQYKAKFNLNMYDGFIDSAFGDIGSQGVLYLRHIILISGVIENNSKTQRYYTYKYPDYEFNWMMNEVGMIAFPRELFSKDISGYQVLFYFHLRDICGSDEKTIIKLRDVYALLGIHKAVTWKAFAPAFLKMFTLDNSILELGETLECSMLGYRVNFVRPMKSLDSVYLEITGFNINKEVEATKKFGPISLVGPE